MVLARGPWEQGGGDRRWREGGREGRDPVLGQRLGRGRERMNTSFCCQVSGL